jgi:hypothetical protein
MCVPQRLMHDKKICRRRCSACVSLFCVRERRREEVACLVGHHLAMRYRANKEAPVAKKRQVKNDVATLNVANVWDARSCGEHIDRAPAATRIDDPNPTTV